MICTGQICADLTLPITLVGDLSSHEELTGVLSQTETLVGDISVPYEMIGELSAAETLVGELSVPQMVGTDIYAGPYEATPKTETSTQVFATALKTMRRDFLVYTIPTTEEYNDAGGVTFTIGEQNGG